MSETSLLVTVPYFGAPFEDPDADIILRSCDDVDFRAFKFILSKASPVFMGMLSLDTPAQLDTSGPDYREGLSVVRLQEKSKTVEHVLRLTNPVPPQNISGLQELHEVTEALLKYDMPVRPYNLHYLLMSLLDKEHPLSVFAVSYRLGEVEAVRAAAKRWLQQPYQPAKADDLMNSLLSGIPATVLFHLDQYRRNSLAAVLSVFRDLRWLAFKPTAPQAHTCKPQEYLSDHVKGDKNTKQWIIHYLSRVEREMHQCLSPSVALRNHLKPSGVRISCAECRSEMARSEADVVNVMAETIEKVLAEVRVASLS